jgi:inner membrane protein
MDSLSQLALGAAVGVAVMGRRTAVWKAAAWGALCGTLPDLDAFVDHGDAVSNMTYHRAESHALFWLTLASPVIAALISRVQREGSHVRRWWLAVWLALVTHPLLDWTTVYGTQLALPFTDHPFGLGSMFIIDPLYTVPLLIGVGVVLVRRHAGLRWNAAGLGLSTAYLVWSFAAQQWVRADVEAALQRQGLPTAQVLVTPTPFNTLLWRVVVMDGDRYHEGFRSLLDHGADVTFDAFPSGAALAPALGPLPSLQRVAWFTHGF